MVDITLRVMKSRRGRGIAMNRSWRELSNLHARVKPCCFSKFEVAIHHAARDERPIQSGWRMQNS
jgi:hypothetical protein